MYTALYRTCRPETFQEILGQEHIVKILKNQVQTQSLSHAYLFCGTRGTGKTTTARILAKAVNCLSEGAKPCGVCSHCMAIKEGQFLDVIEIDAASNNGVDNIRELRESVKYPPAIGDKKVYIIDEVHMLSPGAFNALLKTLEEPPEHVMFILATTEPQKLPPTILSRCMRLDFRRVPQRVIADNMKAICEKRGVRVTEEAVRLLANSADGSVRDGLSILDQVLAGGDEVIDREKVLEYVGTIGEDFFIDLTELVSLKKAPEALVLLNDVLLEGKDVKQLMKDWVSHYRSLLITKFVKDAEDMLNMSSENINKVREQSKQISLEEIDFAVTKLSKTINDARWSTNPRVLFELAIVAIAAGHEYEERPVRKVATAGTPKVEAAMAEVEELEATVPQPKVVKKNAVLQSYSKNNDELWNSIFEDGEGSDGSYTLIKLGTKLADINEDTFTIVANGTFTQGYVEQKKTDLERFMMAKTGKKLRLICKLQDEVVHEKKEDNTSELIDQAEDLLGIKIDIE